MAFTGAPVITQITDKCVRITGVSLAAAAAGVVGLFGSGLEVELPEPFKPQPYKYSDALVDLSEMIRVNYLCAGAALAATAVPIRVVKTLPSGVLTITFTNDDGAAASRDLEIYVFWD